MTLRPLLLLAFLILTAARAHSASARDAFLEMIDRPRVPLAAEVSAPESEAGLLRCRFSFSADAAQRVPGILVKSAAAPANASARRPVVIALHGTGGTKESQLPLLTELAREGFIAVAIDARYHGGRTKTGKGTDAYNAAIARAFRESPTGHSEHPFYFDTVWDIMRLIDYLATRDDVDPARIGVIGFSKGGIETYLAAAVDPRIAVAVPCIGVQSFHWALGHDAAWRSRIETVQPAFDEAARSAGAAQPDASFVRTFYDRVAPGIYAEFDGPAMLPLIAPRPLLSINGETDLRTPLAGLMLCADAARDAYKAAGAEDKFVLLIQPKTGHTVTPASMRVARAWFNYWLEPAR